MNQVCNVCHHNHVCCCDVRADARPSELASEWMAIFYIRNSWFVRPHMLRPAAGQQSWRWRWLGCLRSGWLWICQFGDAESHVAMQHTSDSSPEGNHATGRRAGGQRAVKCEFSHPWWSFQLNFISLWNWAVHACAPAVATTTTKSLGAHARIHIHQVTVAAAGGYVLHEAHCRICCGMLQAIAVKMILLQIFAHYGWPLHVAPAHVAFTTSTT